MTRDPRRGVSRLKGVESEGFAAVRPRGPALCRENRERQAALQGLKSSPKPLSVALKCRERLRSVNRSGGTSLGWLTGRRDGLTARKRAQVSPGQRRGQTARS